jgi:UDP-N-acetylmuramyl tripeptide synthase
VSTVAGRYRTVTLPDGRPLRILLAKNPAGWTEVLHHLAAIDTAVVIAVNARVADGKDPSWLWDVPYELLEGKPVAASGERALDVAVRLHYGDVEHIVEPDPLAAAAALGGEQVHVVASYTQFSALYRRFG